MSTDRYSPCVRFLCSECGSLRIQERHSGVDACLTLKNICMSALGFANYDTDEEYYEGAHPRLVYECSNCRRLLARDLVEFTEKVKEAMLPDDHTLCY